MNKQHIIYMTEFVLLTIVGVMVANQIQKAIDKARVSTPNK